MLPRDVNEQRRLLEAGKQQLSRFKMLAAIRQQDADLVARLLAQETPDIEAIIDVARLLNRYGPAADPEDPAGQLHDKLQRALSGWGMTREQANAEARKAWQSGYRPRTGELEVGSGAM